MKISDLKVGNVYRSQFDFKIKTKTATFFTVLLRKDELFMITKIEKTNWYGLNIFLLDILAGEKLGTLVTPNAHIKVEEVSDAHL